jgi:predicted flap endonuclease-1-like 5' DNA nuclease
VKPDEGGAGPSDDLTRIRGIDPVMQSRLRELGIRRYQDIASFSTRDIKGLSQALGLDARISLENWVGQAQILAAGGQTYYSQRVDKGIPVPETAAATSPAPAAATIVTPAAAPVAAPASDPAPTASPSAAASPASELSHLRSVRSEALIGEDAARSHDPRGAGEGDDLKRIRGIGVLIEKKLYSLGITRYEQIANWTAADIERLSRVLDFKGSIERDNWIEQARILASRGQTQFSRRS